MNLFYLTCGTIFGLFLAQNYKTPNVKKYYDFILEKLKECEKEMP